MKLSDSPNQSETNNPPKFYQILKNCNKLIAKNIASAGSRTRISYIPCERPEPSDYRDLSNTLRNNRYIYSELRMYRRAYYKQYDWKQDRLYKY